MAIPAAFAEDLGHLIRTFEMAESMLTFREEFSESNARTVLETFLPYRKDERIGHLVDNMMRLYRSETGEEYKRSALREAS